MLEQEGYDLMGAAFQVYNVEGHGFLEDVYQECMEVELSFRNIPFDARKELFLCYKGKPLRQKYIPDFFVFGEIIVEIKAVKKLLPEHEA